MTPDEFNKYTWPDVEKGRWFVYVTPEDDYFRVATTVKLFPPIHGIEESWHIGTTVKTDRVDTYYNFKYVIEHLVTDYNKCKKELKELLIREAAHGYER